MSVSDPRPEVERPPAQSGGGFDPTGPARDDEAPLQALFEFMPQLGWAARADGWIYYYNRRWYEYTGTGPADMEGWGWQRVHHPDLLPLVLKRWRHSIATGEPFEMAFKLRRHDGVFRWFLTRVNPMRAADGTISRWIGINTDIDDQKRAEEAAAAASRAKDDFLAMLGHELRNPLAPLTTALRLMELKGDDVFRRERDIIKRQAEHLVRLVDDLLDVARFAGGRLAIHRRTTALADAVRHAIDLAEPLLDARGHALEVDVPADLSLPADAARLTQVVGNLLVNAAKFTGPHGRISVSAAAQDGLVVLRVRDTGVGIPRELLPHVFDMFVQGRQGSERKEGGLGLGLTIARAIVEAHGGRIEAHSGGEGQGSEFAVWLPLTGPLADERAEPPAASPGSPPRRVLIVDDNVDAAETLALALEAAGHTAHVAHDGPAALAAAEVLGPDVVLLDLGLPGMTGYEVAERLRASPRLGAPRLVALTGYGQPADRERTRRAGFDEHLVKPAAVEAVLAALGGTGG